MKPAANLQILAALGRAAAEVTHEENNVLTAMGLNLRALHKAAAGDPGLTALIGALEAGEERSRRLFEARRSGFVPPPRPPTCGRSGGPSTSRPLSRGPAHPCGSASVWRVTRGARSTPR